MLPEISKCCFSKTAVSFTKLVEETVNAAADADSVLASSRLLETARNIVEMYRLTAPLVHASEISNVPLLAGLFAALLYYCSTKSA